MSGKRFPLMLSFGTIPFWRDVRVLRAVSQVVSAILVVGLVVFIVTQVLAAADARGFKLGFDFLQEEAGFPIAESVIEYEESDTFLYAFGVGILNTLKVAISGVILATILGIFVGVCGVSTNWLVRRIAMVYVEIFRNVPLLVQLFFWYFGVFQLLPSVQESIQWPGPIILNNRGIYMVWGDPTAAFVPWLVLLLIAVVVAVVVAIVLSRIESRVGRSTYPLSVAVAIVVVVPVLAWILMPDSPLMRNAPELGRFNYEGGLRLTPEFASLLIGLVVYTAAFIAEVVRGGINSVRRGQTEASRALGLTALQTLRFVVFPQALRVIIPPLISQYLNLTKNSSLAIAIGYPDLFSVGRIMVNQAGRAVPIFLLLMISYLAMSLTYALIGNIYNRRVRFEER
ncbi:MAG: ABC transporter permease subunit [Chloroflexota bacterium]|nr:ABC transporter permease subunit [Chloroflexota bacterium]